MPAEVPWYKRLATFVHNLDEEGNPPAAAPAVHTHAGEDVTSGTVADARVASSIARDSELPDLAGHAAAADPHTGYRLEADNHSHGSSGAQGGQVDHGALGGLADDDHPQYATNAEFDDHSARHEDGGVDEISIAGLAGSPAALDAHLADATDAHAASAITNTPAGAIAATTVQAAINELETEKQPVDADLTAIAGLSPSNDDVVQRKAGAWTNRTIAQLLADLGLASIYQPLDTDLTNIAALSTTATGRSLLAAADAAAIRVISGASAVGHGAADHADATRDVWLLAKDATLDSATLVALDTTPDLVQAIAYADAATQGAYWTVAIPNDWASGNLFAQPIWSPGSTDAVAHTVRWNMGLRRIGGGDNATNNATAVPFTGASAARTAGVVVEDTSTDTGVAVPASAVSLFKFYLQRVGANGADTYVGVVNLLGVRLTYTATQ